MTTHTEGLKPCPMCSSPAKVIRDAGVHHVLCMNMICSTRGPVKVSTEDAVAAWNTRPAQASEAIRNAALEVLSFRDGDLPTRGWLKDCDASRQSLFKLASALSTTPAEPVPGMNR